ncbi:MAG: hypothetical protein K8R68_11620, partial [Bacteroidales bacterium]|nr:hypothetical protein [Bacteroidales bacterium]
MKKYIKEVLILVLILLVNQSYSQFSMDSVLRQRNIDYLDYKHFKETMGERTWLNMVNLNLKSDNVINIDNEIINTYLYQLQDHNKQLLEQVNKLSFEISLLKKEEETSRL